jgi:hypothetical protein
LVKRATDAEIYFRYQSIRRIDHNVVCSIRPARSSAHACLHSPADRAAIALVRAMQKPSRKDTQLRIVRLVAATHPVSQALSIVLWIRMIEPRNQLDMFSEKGTANAPPQPRLPI